MCIHTYVHTYIERETYIYIYIYTYTVKDMGISPHGSGPIGLSSNWVRF